MQSEFRARLEADPDGRALTFLDSRGRFQWRSFADVFQSAAKVGSILASKGLRKGDAVVLVVPSDQDACHAVLGCLLIGALPVLVAPPVVHGVHSNLDKVIRHVTRKVSASMLIIGDDAVEVAAELRGRRSQLQIVNGPDDWRDGDASAAPLALPSDGDVVAYQLTSGTTGLPKVCVWRQRRVLASLDGMIGAMNLSREDIFQNWTPLYHDMGLVNNFLLCMVHRIPLVMMETMDFLKRPSLWLRGLAATGATTTWSPNFGYALAEQRISDSEMEGVRLEGVRGFWNAAERVHLGTMLAFQRRFEPYGVSLRQMKTNFGCAENVGGATFSDPDGDFVVERVDGRKLYENGVAEPLTRGNGDDRAVDVVSVGRPFPGMSIDIVTRTGKRLPDGRVGEVVLNTPSRMLKYLGNVKETSRALRGDGVRTGDLGYQRGDELFWVGRVQERINLHGKKFDPSDFEQALFDIDSLRKGCFAVFGVDDEDLGTQRLVIVSEIYGADAELDRHVFQAIKENVMQQVGIGVDEVVLLESGTMSKTSSGKRRHRFYRQQYVDGQLQSLQSARRLTA